MRFKTRRPATLPEVNLVPMMDVLMSVLTFFIITSMTLTGERLGNINIPGAGGGTQAQSKASLIIGLNREGEILLNDRVINEAELATQMQEYLAATPEGTIILKADRELPYTQVAQLLKKMGQIGGDRVSLAIEKR
jgi:biopolymer transport protein ExbD